jgi:lactose/L-arabinose transport system permease protein
MRQDATASPTNLVALQKQRGRWAQLRREIVRNRWAYVFISPFYILFVIFGLFPVAFSLYLSFFEWNGVRPMVFVGLKNFEFLLGPGGRAFWQSVGNSLILFVMYVPIMTFLAIVLAVLLNTNRVKGFRIFRTFIFAPYVTSMIAAGITFGLMFATNGGIFNLILEGLGLAPVPWLEDIWWARVSLCILIVWGWLGYNMVLMLAGLQTIPKELNEAALIDGASHTQVLFRVTIPLLRPIILFSVVLSTIGTFGLFNEVMSLTGGGPMRGTTTPLVQIYGTAFGDFRFGRASAQAYMYTTIIFILTMIQFRFAGRQDDETGGQFA